jgi:alpha-beta hydrolase superfamily lysophospholipase
MGLAFADELFDAQFTRALACARYGGADLGECFGTAARIGKVDVDLWYREWFATAARAEKAGAYLRASNYYRTAGLFLLRAPVDDRLRHGTDKQTETFRKGVAELASPPERVAIPYEDTTLPGYFFRASDSPGPVVILTNGYDGTVEELYFASGAAALERGYHVLAFDGPGQGSVLLEQGLPFRPDWENVVTPVVDHALTRPEVDPAALVLVGWSFGGYLAPRAATAEHRLAACVSDCGPYDLFDATVARMPGVLARHLPDGNRMALRLLERALDYVLTKPTAGWALRRNLLVHDVADPMAFLAMAREYTLRGRESMIRCPTLVCATEGDDLSARAKTLADKLTCPHEYASFGPADDVSGHCEMTGRETYHARVFAWLDSVLGKSPQ